MNPIFRRLAFPLLTLASTAALGHGAASSGPDGTARLIDFPNTADYQTLVVDLHTHSVFSDGHVWPRIRVGEALRDGLDALAITEHLEWQPHRADIPHPDRNRAIRDAEEAGGDHDLIIIAGSEITREAPAGHMNAVFITDANALVQAPNPPTDGNDVVGYYQHAAEWPAEEAVQAANDQGAFVFWNHPDWTAQQPDGIASIPSFHKKNAKAGLLHGIEIANGNTFSEEAFAIALKYKLALIGVSDVHNLIDWDYEPHNGGHRPVTLVLAKERSAAGIREALFDRRTVVWYKNLLVGREEHLLPLLEASVRVVDAAYVGETSVLRLDIENISDATLSLDNDSRYTFLDAADMVTLPAHSVTTLSVKPGKRVDSIELEFEVENALIEPGESAELTLRVDIN